MDKNRQKRPGFVENVLGIMPRLEVRRVKTQADYEAVFNLRRKAYAHGDLVRPESGDVTGDRYDIIPNSQIFALLIDGELVSSIRIHKVDASTPWSPTNEYFPQLVNPIIEEGKSFVDASRFCVDPDRKADLSALPYLTVRVAYMAALHFGTFFTTLVTRKQHAAFYTRFFGFERIGDEYMVDWFKAPINLYASEIEKNHVMIDTRLPFMTSSFEERLMLFSDDLVDQGITSIIGRHGSISSHSRVTSSADRQTWEWLEHAAAS